MGHIYLINPQGAKHLYKQLFWLITPDHHWMGYRDYII